MKKIEKLRLKAIKIIFGKDITDKLNDKEKLKLINRKTIEELYEINNNINIHKIMTTKKPTSSYQQLTDARDINQIKYNHINTVLRSEEKYNVIPCNVRSKSVKNFKLSYKRHKKDLITKPRFIKNTHNNTYHIVWPGTT